MSQAVTNGVDGFIMTTALKKLRKLKKRTKVIPGGTSAAKTYSIIPILIDEAIKIPNSEISIVSESVPHLRRGSLKDFLKIMKVTGRYNEDNYNKTQLTYTFSNGSYIEFFSADQEEKIRGPRRNTLYCNEVNNLSFDTYYQLAIRTSRSIWLDFNPSNEFWVYKECPASDQDTEWLTLTYKDNEGLPQSIKEEIEKAMHKAYFDPYGNISDPKNVKNAYWDNFWRVYGLGQLGSLEGVIFNNWTIIDEIPKEAKLVGIGLDWGFSNDETAAVEMYEYGDKYVLNQIIYKKGLLNSEIAAMLPKGVKIWADSAEPKSIEELKRLELNIAPVVKGKDSVVYGIQLMQQQDYLVTASSVDGIKELRQYAWDEDKFGNKLNKPVDALNHFCDASRYVTMMTVGKVKRKAVFGWDD